MKAVLCTQQLRKKSFSAGRKTRTIFYIAILAIICFGLRQSAFAQFDTGTINGTVADPSGAVVPNAAIIVTNVDTSIRTALQSNRSGNFVASGLPFGRYVVSATASGFGPASTQPITLTVGATVQVNLVLNIASANATVQVTGTGTTVDTSSSSSGTTLSSVQISNLPVNGRDVSDFLEVSPGSVGSAGYFQGSINGLENIFTGLNIKLDGQTATRGDINGFLDTEGGEAARVTRASVDSIQEIDFANSGYGADSGFSLGPQMNIITKSGTNQFHGEAFEFFRNQSLDARDYFNQTGPNQPLKLNQFGGNLAGPILKNKFFFFVNYEGDRTTVTAINPTYEVPSAYVRSKFVAAMQPVLAMMEALPSGCGLGSTIATCPYDTRYPDNGTYDLVFTPANLPTVLREDTGSMRFDYRIGDNDSLMFRYNINDSITTQTYGLNQGQVAPQALRTQLGKIDETHTFSPTLLNEFSVAVNRFYSDTNSNTPTPLVGFGGFFTNLGSLPGPNSFNQVTPHTQPEIFDTLTKIIGAHSLKFGAQIRLDRLNEWLRPQQGYEFASFSDLENDNPFVLEKIGFPSMLGIKSSNWDFYGQDNWRINRNLTVNLGLRYDYNTAWNESHGRQQNYDYATLSFLPEGQTYHAPRTDFAPRVGFAYDPYGQGKTVIHGYGGLFYMPMQMGFGLVTNIPSQSSYNINLFDALFANPPFSIAYPSPNPPLVPGEQSASIFPLNPRDPVSTNWLFGIQQEVARNTVMTINYTGNRVQHTQAGIDFAAINLNPSNPNSNYPRPLSGKTSIQDLNYDCACLFSKYNALQVQLRSNINRLSLEANYAWSHETDNEVNVFSNWSDPFDISHDIGNGDWDVRHNLTVSAVYNLPDLKGSSRLVRETLGGWQASSIFQGRTGDSSDITVISGFFGNPMRPDYVPGQPLLLPGHKWPSSSYNLAAYKLEPGFNGVWGDPTTIGNVGRNSVRAPAFVQWDLSGMKNFPITQKVTAQFRADIFNIFNHPNFEGGDGGICSSITYPAVITPATPAVCAPNTRQVSNGNWVGFGTVSQTIADANGSEIGNGTARQIQLSAKLTF